MLIIGGSRSGRTNSLFNLIYQQPDIDKIYFYAKNSYEARYQLLIKKRDSTSLKHCNDFKAFIDYSIDIANIYKNIEEYSETKNKKNVKYW